MGESNWYLVMKRLIDRKYLFLGGARLAHKIICLILCVICLNFTVCATIDPSKDVELTWENAIIRIPGLLPVTKEHRDKYIKEMTANKKYPTVIFMHGGGGLGYNAQSDIEVVLEQGYAVIAPDSFARERQKNPGIDLSYTCSGPGCFEQFDRIFNLRTAELAYALGKARQVPWIDQNNLFGWGHSEGGYTMAAYPGAIFKGRIITGTGCHRGFNAKEPVLVVVAVNDPYMHKSHLENESPTTCRIKSRNASNLTYIELPGFTHHGAQIGAGRRAIIKFLKQHTTTIP